ncbi:MAG: heme exporter protein CcmB [Acidobacteriota bacterium]|nr:heme exporter protein CcmB [Acidobacteriota bacterium]
MNGLATAFAIARKDLRTEFRTKESINASASFALVILVIFSFAFNLERDEFYAISGGLLWLVFSFAGALIVNRAFARELPNDCLDVLITSPAPGWSIFLGKAIAAFCLLMIVEAISLPVFGLFYNIQWTNSLGSLVVITVLATWGMTIVGAAFSAVIVNVRLRELMLPVLLYPILIPLLIAAMGGTTALFNGESLFGENFGYVRQLVVFDAIYTALALYMIEFILVV